MEINGVQRIPASREAVWQALNDPDTLKRCLPGCESVERQDEETFLIVITAAVGPLRPRFQGVLRLTQAAPPESCVMLFEGQGGALGFGKGEAAVTLAEAGDETELSYTAQAQVGGKLAQVGSRLIDSVAKKMSDDFFKAFRRQFSAATEAPASTAQAEVTPVAAAAAPAVAPAMMTPGAPPPSPLAGLPADSGAPAVPLRPADGGPVRVMVPGWWLFAAFALGAAATIAGALLAG